MLPFQARSDLGVMAIKGYYAFLKGHHLNLTIRLFTVISRTLVRGVLPHCRCAVWVFYNPNRLNKCVVCYKNNWLLGLVGRVFANGPGDRGSIPVWVIPKTLKMVLKKCVSDERENYEKTNYISEISFKE